MRDRIRIRLGVTATLLLFALLATQFPVMADCPPLFKPTLLSPEDGATGVPSAPTLEIRNSPLFPDPDCDYEWTEWQIATSSSFSEVSLVFDEGPSKDDTTQLNVPLNTLAANTTYWWRARVYETKTVTFVNFPDKPSEWSTPASFTTLGFAILTCNWGSFKPITPENNAEVDSQQLVTLTLNRILILGGNNCVHESTHWQIEATQQGGTFTVLDEVDSQNLTQIQLTNLLPDTIYGWRFRLIDENGEESDWSESYQFKTSPQPNCAWASFSNREPENGATNVSLTPTLAFLGSFRLVNVPQCQADKIEYQVATTASFEFAVYAETITEPPAIVNPPLNPGQTYYWRVRLHMQGREPSNWTTPTSFTTSTGGNTANCNWDAVVPNVPANGATNTNLNLTLAITIAPANDPRCSYGYTDWQVALDMGFGNIVYEDEMVDETSINVPNGVLNMNTTYYWRARLYGNDGEGPWSNPYRFTTMATTPNNMAPNANFTVSNSTPNVGEVVSFTDMSNDPDGPNEIVSWDWDFGDGQSSTTPSPTHSFNQSGTYNVQLTVRDAGGLSNTLAKTIMINMGGGALSLETAVARLISGDPSGPNADERIGDQEIRQAITIWILGQTVPGTDGLTINDIQMLRLITLWITGGAPASAPQTAAKAMMENLKQNVANAMFTQPTPLRLSQARLQPLTGTQWRLSVTGQSIAQVQLDVFDTSGRLVVSQRSSGNALSVALTTRQGAPLANGVYLYSVTAYDDLGNQVRSPIKKVAVLR